MKLSHRIIIYSSIGLGYGTLAGVLISAFLSAPSYSDGAIHICSDELIAAVGNPLLALTLQVVLCGLYGAMCMGGSAIYSIEKWGLLKCTLIHYAATMGGFLLISLILKWYSRDEIPALLLMLLILTLVYLLIWLANFISYRIQLNKINRKIDLLKAKDRK